MRPFKPRPSGVIECVEYADANKIIGNHDDNNYFNLRGEVLPLVKLNDHFDYAIDKSDSNERSNIVVVHSGGRKAGLVVITTSFVNTVKKFNQNIKAYRHN